MEQSQLLKQILNTPNGVKMYREIGTLGNVSKDHLNQALYAFTDNRILKRSKLNEVGIYKGYINKTSCGKITE